MNISQGANARNVMVEGAFFLLYNDIEGRLDEFDKWIALAREATTQQIEGHGLALRASKSLLVYLDGLAAVSRDARSELATRQEEATPAAQVFGYEHLPLRPEPSNLVQINPEWGGDVA